MLQSRTFAATMGAQDLIDQATAETGLSDLADDTMRAGLERFAVMMAESGHNASERTAGYGQMVNLLSWRLRMVADRAGTPAIAEERIDAPLIVIGFPRCGTTLLHMLLTVCPANRAPLWWEVARPSPPPSLAGPHDPRIGAANRDMERWLADYPGFIRQHPYHDEGAFSSLECEALMNFQLRNGYPMLLPSVPFTPWADNTDPAASYRAHHEILQQLQYGAATPRRWVLKGVEHQYRAAALLEQYPDAMLVWPHRDPVEVFGSLLAVTFEVVRFSGASTDDRRGFSEGILRSYAARADIARQDPIMQSDRVCHVRYRDFVRDQVGTVEGIYDHFGLSREGVPEAVRGWLDDPANDPARHGKWTYDLADFGVTADEIRELFADYIVQFDV